jgi:hypothetical protein
MRSLVVSRRRLVPLSVTSSADATKSESKGSQGQRATMIIASAGRRPRPHIRVRRQAAAPLSSAPLQPRSDKLMRVTILSQARMSLLGYSMWTHFSECEMKLQRS